MDLTAEQFEDLVGAYALDACEPAEVEAMERYVVAHPDAAGEIERLRDVAAGLGAVGASRPPVALRDRLLVAAGERVRPLRADEALQEETNRFDQFLTTVTDADLGVMTENGLTLHQLLQHVEAVDRAFVAAADDPDAAFIGADEVAAITAADLPGRADESFAESVTRFRRTRAELISLHESLPAEQRVAGYGRDDTLVIRVFETWTHHDDMRRALDRPAAEAKPAVMRTMAELAMKSLPLALAVNATPHAGKTVRLVLTGPGGGEWTFATTAGDEPGAVPDAVVHAPVAAWCRRFADRLTPDDVGIDVDGDAVLARDLVTAANAFAGL